MFTFFVKSSLRLQVVKSDSILFFDLPVIGSADQRKPEADILLQKNRKNIIGHIAHRDKKCPSKKTMHERENCCEKKKHQQQKMKFFKQKSPKKYFPDHFAFCRNRFIVWIFFSDYFIHNSAILSVPVDENNTTLLVSRYVVSKLEKFEKRFRKEHRH